MTPPFRPVAAPPRLPPGEACDATHLPPAARTLLDHGETMTRRLERVAGGGVGVRVLWRADEPGGVHLRAVVLVAPGGAPLELGLARVDVARLPAAAAEGLRAEREPLGRLLEQAAAAAAAQVRVAVAGFRRWRGADVDAFLAASDAAGSAAVPSVVFGRETVLAIIPAEGGGRTAAAPPVAWVTELLLSDGGGCQGPATAPAGD